MGIRVGLWSVGSGLLLVDAACWHRVRVGGLLVVVGCSLLALVLLVHVRRPPRVHGGVRWPECCAPVQWGRYVVLDRVVVVVKVCWLCVVPWRWWVRG